MRPLAELIAEASRSQVRLDVEATAVKAASAATIDGLFHVPLLALTIVTIVRARRTGLATRDVATWTLGTLSKHFEALRLSKSHLRWSVLLRRRCADALVFLETSGLIAVQEGPPRTLKLTLNGRGFIAKASAGIDETGVLARQLARAYQSVVRAGLELL
jgi:hypothetical protein